MKKPILGIYSLTCCEGCQVELINLGERLLELFEIYDLGNFSWVEEKKDPKKFDVVLVEGSPMTEENFKTLKELRKKSKVLVALGTCAHLGGIQKIKNYTENKKGDKVKMIYKDWRKIYDVNIDPISNIVKVDYVIPQCQINKEEAYKILVALATGREPYILNRPVCYECQTNGYECLLQLGEPCLGPITLGGCGAVCFKSKRFCYGCRGPVKGIDPSKHLANLKNMVGEKYLKDVMETFGAEDEILGQANKFE
jgi:sulfhydrogenase subunit delta